jgi:signal transduction histidine kinase
MQEAERVRSELLGNVSHELRNPLGLILFLVTALRKPDLDLDDSKRAEFLQDIEYETRNLQGIVDSLLEASRMQNGLLKLSPVSFELHDMLDRTVKFFQSQMPNHRLECCFPDEKLFVRADEDKLGQVLRNLLSNAAKFSPVGSVISLRTETVSNEIRIIVSDQGPGIPPAERDRIFERFYRIKNLGVESVSGLGLGLSISREIVNAHGGQIWVEDGSEGGSVFVVALPARLIKEDL